MRVPWCLTENILSFDPDSSHKRRIALLANRLNWHMSQIVTAIYIAPAMQTLVTKYLPGTPYIMPVCPQAFSFAL
jgi:hypothetical protein